MQAVSYARGYAKIDLDAIQSNIENMKRNIIDGTQMMLVVKADGYGHGASVIAKTFESLDYIWGFGVATLDEGVMLRNEGITKPILILGCVFPEQYGEALQHELRINIYNEEMAIKIAKLGKLAHRTVHVHIKIDSGMSRLGFLCNSDSVDAIERIANLEYIKMEGIFTHLSKADEVDKSYTEHQFSDFMYMVEELEKRHVVFPFKHASNSAGIFDHPECNLDMVRAGISIYGLYPSEEVQKRRIPLTPVMTFMSSVASVKTLETGTKISYGGLFETPHTMRVATIPIGYADGYARTLSNKGYVLIYGKKAPILGRVCMDQFMVDVTDIPEVEFMTPVTLIGKSNDAELPVEVLSEMSDKFNYEFVCGINKRIPRIYIKNGEIEDQIDYFA